METKKLLVAIDFKEESVNALKYSINLAKSINAKVYCLYVVEEAGFITSLFINSETVAKINEAAEKRLAETVDPIFEGSGVEYEKIVQKGKAFNEIVSAAKDNKVNFIVMGRKNRLDFAKNVIGSNTNHIISASRIPVITINNNNSYLHGSHVLLPLDLSQPVAAKVGNAIHLAKLLGARITVLSVISEELAFLKAKFNRRMQLIEEQFVEHGVQCETKMVKSDDSPATQINNYTKEIDADLIMIMTQKELDLHDYFIGSTAQTIITNSRIPVISTIPSSELDQAGSVSVLKQFFDPLNLFRSSSED